MRTSQAVATVLLGFGNCVQPKVAPVKLIDVAVKAFGFLQVGAGAQVTLATHPGLFTEASLLNLKVKQPSVLLEVNGPGMVVPQKAPAKPPGTLPAGLVLAICGAVVLFPSKTYNPSHEASTSKAVKVTVTKSPGVVGQMV
ncbi:hypothetical protein FLBR109950_15870 [Flavobacterium branchiophilum]